MPLSDRGDLLFRVQRGSDAADLDGTELRCKPDDDSAASDPARRDAEHFFRPAYSAPRCHRCCRHHRNDRGFHRPRLLHYHLEHALSFRQCLRRDHRDRGLWPCARSGGATPAPPHRSLAGGTGLSIPTRTETRAERDEYKGGSESGTIGAPAAIGNAVIDALWHLGVRDITLPISSETVWRAVCDARRTRRPEEVQASHERQVV